MSWWNPLGWPPAIGRGCLSLFGWLHVAICALTTEDGRKGWAMLAALGCAIAMTAYSAAALYLVRQNSWFAFLLGLAAMVLNLIVVTGLMVLLGVKRKTSAKVKDAELTIEDEGDQP